MKRRKRTPKNVKELAEFMEQVLPVFIAPDRWSEVGSLSNFDEFIGSVTYNTQPKRSLSVGSSTNTKWSVTGEEYIEYAIGTKVDAFYRSKSGFKNPEEMLCKWMWNTFVTKCHKLNEDGHKLYWRIKPEYDEWIDHEKIAKIYTRYLISNKPEISDGTRSIGMLPVSSNVILNMVS